MGPSNPEYPTSQPKMYALKSLNSFQGIMSNPAAPVIKPPVRKEINRGFKFEKSLDGDTTLAATLVFNVAIRSAISATNATTGWWKRPMSWTGSQMGSPKSTADAEVTATPMNA